MKPDKSSILVVMLVGITIVIIGAMVILVNSDSSIFDKVGVFFRYCPMIISFGVMCGCGFWIFLTSKSKNIRNTVFPWEGEQSIFFWFFYIFFWGWVYLNILIPYVYLYNIKPIGPQEKYHYINSNIPQLLETNSSIPMVYGLYFLSALPLVIILTMFIYVINIISRIWSLKELIKLNVVEENTNHSLFYNLMEEFFIYLIIFIFVYFSANFTYPTIVYLINK